MESNSLYDFFESVTEEQLLESGLEDIKEGIVRMQRALAGLSDDDDPRVIKWELQNTVERLCHLRLVNGRERLHEFFKGKLEGKTTESEYNLDTLLTVLFEDHAVKAEAEEALLEDGLKAIEEGIARFQSALDGLSGEDLSQITLRLQNIIDQLCSLGHIKGRQVLDKFFMDKLEGKTDEKYDLNSLLGTLFTEHVAAKVASLVDQGKELENDVTTSSIGHSEAAAKKQDLVREVIKLHADLKNFIVFSHSRLYRALQDGFRRILDGSTFFSVQLAKYCDNILRKGKFTDEEMEKKIDTIVELIDLLGDKDYFFELYRQQLANRLLLNQSAGLNFENIVISKLKNMSRCHFTKKMEVMVEEREAELCTFGPMDITVVSRFHWPRYPEVDITLPEEMERSRTAFGDFYKAAKHKKLSWPYSVGTCIVNATFDGQEFEIIASVSQAALLMLFNDNDMLSGSEIKARLGITEEVFSSLVHSLCCSEYKLITVEQTGDLIVLNSSFNAKENKIQLPVPKVIDEAKVIEEVIDETKVIEEVGEWRLRQTETALVRIAKRRKVIRKTELINECVEELQGFFKPSISMIETQIIRLAEEEGYLKKVDGASEDGEVTYRYIP